MQICRIFVNGRMDEVKCLFDNLTDINYQNNTKADAALIHST